MSRNPTRILIERSLDSLPAIQDIIRDPDPEFQITLSDRANIPTAEYADIILLAGDIDEESTLDRVWMICRARHYPKVLLITPGNAGQLCEEAIVQGASGVIDHAAPASLIRKALTCLARGELWLDRQRTGRVFDRLSRGMIKKSDRDDHVVGC